MRRNKPGGIRALMLEGLKDHCDKLMTPGDSLYLDYRERTNPAWSSRFGIFVVTPAINALASAYALTGEARYGDAARDAMMAIIDHNIADVDALAYGTPTKGWRHGPGHDKALFGQCLAWCYDFCHDRFTAEQRRRVVAFARECITLADEHRDFDNAQVTNNRGSRALIVPALLCLTFGDELGIDDANRRVRDGIVALEKFLFLAFDAQGAYYEGPGYGGGTIYHAAFAWALQRHGYGNFADNNRFERYAQYLLYELIPGGGAVNNLNDANWPAGSVLPALVSVRRPEGAILPWLARQLDLRPAMTGENRDFKASDLAQGLERSIFWMLWWDDDLLVRTPGELGYPLSNCFRTRGVASLRTGWGADDWLVSHFCGRQELFCHRQGDYNHVALYALGERFLIDAGYGHGSKDPTQPLDDWYKRTTAHNCVLVDGADQRSIASQPGWAEGEMLDFQHTPAFDTTLGDASSTSGAQHRVNCSLRRVAMVREGPAPYLAIVDVNEKDGKPFTAEARWNTHADNSLERSPTGFTILGKANDCHAHVLWPELSALEIETTSHYGRPQVKVRSSAAVSELVTIFCPTRRGGPAPTFTCRRLGDGEFTITCELDGQRSTLTLSAATDGPLRRPGTVQFQKVS